MDFLIPTADRQMAQGAKSQARETEISRTAQKPKGQGRAGEALRAVAGAIPKALKIA
jgi:hypothetical protein